MNLNNWRTWSDPNQPNPEGKQRLQGSIQEKSTNFKDIIAGDIITYEFTKKDKGTGITAGVGFRYWIVVRTNSNLLDTLWITTNYGHGRAYCMPDDPQQAWSLDLQDLGLERIEGLNFSENFNPKSLVLTFYTDGLFRKARTKVRLVGRVRDFARLKALYDEGFEERNQAVIAECRRRRLVQRDIEMDNNKVAGSAAPRTSLTGTLRYAPEDESDWRWHSRTGSYSRTSYPYLASKRFLAGPTLTGSRGQAGQDRLSEIQSKSSWRRSDPGSNPPTDAKGLSLTTPAASPSPLPPTKTTSTAYQAPKPSSVWQPRVGTWGGQKTMPPADGTAAIRERQGNRLSVTSRPSQTISSSDIFNRPGLLTTASHPQMPKPRVPKIEVTAPEVKEPAVPEPEATKSEAPKLEAPKPKDQKLQSLGCLPPIDAWNGDHEKMWDR